MNTTHKTRTLWLVGILHAFTHVYQVALVPLYLPIQRDFQLASAGQATLLVTVLMLAYFLPSYGMGILADRCSRKKLLGWGLFLNAAAFVGLAFAPNYGAALGWVFLSGLGGSFFHPAATAMVARLYPVGTGRALGLIGIGASIRADLRGLARGPNGQLADTHTGTGLGGYGGGRTVCLAGG
jgi:FSR family fosmidomycin resistance protein-like MFS transporter